MMLRCQTKAIIDGADMIEMLKKYATNTIFDNVWLKSA